MKARIINTNNEYVLRGNNQQNEIIW